MCFSSIETKQKKNIVSHRYYIVSHRGAIIYLPYESQRFLLIMLTRVFSIQRQIQVVCKSYILF
jgi:hypothetical protein